MRSLFGRAGTVRAVILLGLAGHASAGQEPPVAAGTLVRLQTADAKSPLEAVVVGSASDELLVDTRDGRRLSLATSDVVAVESRRRETGQGIASGVFSGVALYGAAGLASGAGAASVAVGAIGGAMVLPSAVAGAVSGNGRKGAVAGAVVGAAAALALNRATGGCCCGVEAAAWGAGAGALSGAVAGAVARERWRPQRRRPVRLSLGRPPRGKGIAARVTVDF